MTNRDPKPGFEEDIAWKRAVHEIRMEENITNDVEFSYDMFQDSLKMLKKKGGGKYKSILRAGKAYHDALYKIFEVVWKNERKPETWRNSVLIQLPKKSKDKADLNSR